ncbi:MAG: HD domain-containing protein [Candidatus Omnitrophica bacterium]|nr:HD domain-containing protein [Candidatus Omnitrophota bacterium]
MDKTTKNIFKALMFAVEAHGYQARKRTKIPYIVHPLGVGKILIENGFSESLVVAGILHDVIEDTPITEKEIREKFGAKVVRLIKGCSEPDKTKSWRERKDHTIEMSKKVSLDILIVECADKLDNIRAIKHDYTREGEKFWKRLSAPKKDQKWYYQSLAKIFVNRMKDEPAALLAKAFKKGVISVFGSIK